MLKFEAIYNHHWNSLKSILLYPRTNKQQDVEGAFNLKWDGRDHYCRLGFVDVISGEHLNSQLAFDILEKIQTNDHHESSNH